MLTTILSIIFSISAYTILISSPITIGLSILTLAIISSAIFALINSSWISFLIFLIYISGTLIIFAYFVAITPNITLMPPIYIPIIIITPLLTIYAIYLIEPSIKPSTFTHISNTFYTTPTSPILIIIVLLLLYTIIVVVKTSSFSKGPLRPFTNRYV